MKRGVDIEMVHFFSPPYTSEQALNKAKELTSKLTAFGGISTLLKFLLPKFKKLSNQVFQKVT
jgi:Thiamine biosynthesis ATP pyrophosphatase